MFNLEIGNKLTKFYHKNYSLISRINILFESCVNQYHNLKKKKFRKHNTYIAQNLLIKPRIDC